MMMMKRGQLAAIGAVALVIAVAPFVVPVRSSTTQCFQDGQCTLVVGGIEGNTGSFLSGWVEAGSIFGKGSVHAGPNDESELSGDGLVTDEVSTGAVYANYIEAGSLYVYGSKQFRIDHPLDPANRYLNHWSIESDEIKNIYDGMVTLDQTGSASVSLPTWFQKVNTDFRYQLTSIGKPGANLYVAEEISEGKFKIVGGTPGSKVSWQVTGIRQDPGALNHRPVEEAKKPEDRGRYIHPTAYGQPESLKLVSGLLARSAATPRPITKSNSKLGR